MGVSQSPESRVPGALHTAPLHGLWEEPELLCWDRFSPASPRCCSDAQDVVDATQPNPTQHRGLLSSPRTFTPAQLQPLPLSQLLCQHPALHSGLLMESHSTLRPRHLEAMASPGLSCLLQDGQQRGQGPPSPGRGDVFPCRGRQKGECGPGQG